MTKSDIQAVMQQVDQANPGLRTSNRYLWTEKVAFECYKTDKTVGQKRADLGRPVSDDTLGWMKSGPPMAGAPGTATKTPMTAVDLLDGTTGAMHFNEIDLTTGTLQYFVIPPASGQEASAPGSTYPPYPGDTAFDPLGEVLFADYEEADHPPNPQMSCWYGRTIYDWLTGIEPTLDKSIVKHRHEWRTELGLPPVA
jgi:hypothetical protein